MKFRWVIGAGVCLEQVFGTWTHAYPQENVEKIELLPDANYTFDLSALDALNPLRGTMFVAYDERVGNLKDTRTGIGHDFSPESFVNPSAVLPPDLVRMKLVQAATERGFTMESFVSPSAIVSPDAAIGLNVFVGEGAVLGIGSRIDLNTVIRDGARLGARVHVHPSCLLETGVLVGDDAEIGSHSTLRIGAVVGPRVKIGKYCELGWARLYGEDVAAGTVFDPRYEEPIYVYGE